MLFSQYIKIYSRLDFMIKFLYKSISFTHSQTQTQHKNCLPHIFKLKTFCYNKRFDSKHVHIKDPKF